MFDVFDDGSSSFAPPVVAPDHVFAALPQPVLTRILSFLHFGPYVDPDPQGSIFRSNASYDAGFQGLVSLASSDKFLQHLVYKKCTFLWEDLELSYMPKLIDAQLHTFLERINAVQVTRCIRLRECTITGSGLTPLTGSRVLEAIDMVGMNPTPTVPATVVPLADVVGIDHPSLWPILDSMLPWKLASVRYDSNGTQLDAITPPAMRNFVLRFAEATARRLVEQNKACSFCNDCQFRDVITPNNDRVAANVFASSQCFVCKKYTCQPWVDNSRCPWLQTCHNCKNPYCNDCSLECCDVCKNSYYCSTCRARRHCDLCDKIICQWCRPVSHCMYCQNFSCRECCNSFFQCDICLQWACSDCHKSGCLTCIKANNKSGCRFGSQCYRCGYSLNETELLADPCPYCFEKYCSNATCSPHACISPKDQVFRSRNTGGGKDHQKTCPCGHVMLQRAKGQQFLCNFVTRK